MKKLALFIAIILAVSFATAAFAEGKPALQKAKETVVVKPFITYCQHHVTPPFGTIWETPAAAVGAGMAWTAEKTAYFPACYEAIDDGPRLEPGMSSYTCYVVYAADGACGKGDRTLP